ncbi:zinc knuckle [Cooperia oncophora]
MPVTRSMAKSASSSTVGASAQPSDTKSAKPEPFPGAVFDLFDDYSDDTPLLGRDAKLIRDATTSALTQVWNDSCASTALLTRRINENNEALKEKLSESFAVVGRRLDLLPSVLARPPRDRDRRIAVTTPQASRTWKDAVASAIPRSGRPRSLVRTTDYRCFNCGGVGHFASSCPSPRRSASLGFAPRARPAVPRPRAGYPPPLPQASFLSPKSAVPSRRVEANDEAALDVTALSASLRDSQAQLAHSQARVSALLRRNEELAQSSLSAPSSPHGFQGQHRAPSLPDVRLLLCSVLIVSALVSPAQSVDAWLCPHEGQSTFFHFPAFPDCSSLWPNISSDPVKATVLLYRPNTQLYSTPAVLCKIVRQSVTFSVGFFGTRTETHYETSLPVSVEECRRMARHHNCLYGSLRESSGVWRTSHELHFQFPSAPFGCCTNHTAEVTNCFWYATTVHTRHNDAFPQAPVGDLSNCAYADGFCTLADGSLLLWTPNREERCAYTLVSRMTGELSDGVWISRDREFALSWTNSSATVMDCDHSLILTDQGYGVELQRRQPRSSAPNVGLVTSNQLSAQLLAVESASLSAMGTLFRNALRTLCDRTNTISIALQAALYAHPTPTMRALLGRQDIAASFLGDGYIQVRRCVALPSSALSFLPFNHTCYTFPQVELRLPSATRMRAFLDPLTGIIHKHGTPVSCSDTQPFLFPSNDGIRSYDPRSGRWSSFTPKEVTKLPPASPQQAFRLAPPLTVFHNLILTNFSEASNDHQLHELWVARDHSRLLDHFSRADAPSAGGQGSTVAADSSVSSFFSLFSSFPSPFDFWVTCCCIFVTFSFFKSLLCFYLRLQFPHLFQQHTRSPFSAIRPRPLALPPPTTTTTSPHY